MAEMIRILKCFTDYREVNLFGRYSIGISGANNR